MDKLLSVACVSGGITVLSGLSRGGLLHILERAAYKKTSDLTKHFEQKGSRFTRAVDTHNLSFPFAVLKTPLGEVDDRGRPRLLAALDAYRYLSGNNLIRFQKETITLNESVVTPQTDFSGKTTYIIDWESMRPEQQALLLLCYHAHHHQTLEVQYQHSFWARFNALQNEHITGGGFIL